jgi:hypothetical protein
VTTANTLIKDALIGIGAIGVAETPDPDDGVIALRILNRILDAWRIKGLYAFAVSEQVITLTSAMQTRTIGPSGQVNATRPVRLETGCFVRVSGVDSPLRVASRDEWAGIELKTQAGSPPDWVYYESTSPLGVLHFHPQADCEAHLMVAGQLTAFANLATDYTLPPGYELAIEQTLEERLCSTFSRPLPPTLKADAANARTAIKRANYQVPELELPIGARYRSSNQAAFNSGV